MKKGYSEEEQRYLQRATRRTQRAKGSSAYDLWAALPDPPPKRKMGRCARVNQGSGMHITVQCDYCFEFGLCDTCQECCYCQRKKRKLFNVFALTADRFSGYWEIVLLAEALNFPAVPVDKQGQHYLPTTADGDVWLAAFHQLNSQAKNFVYAALIAHRDGVDILKQSRKRG